MCISLRGIAAGHLPNYGIPSKTPQIATKISLGPAAPEVALSQWLKVKSLRSSGAKLKFYDLVEGGERIQAGCKILIPVVAFLKLGPRSDTLNLGCHAVTRTQKGDQGLHESAFCAQVMCSPQMHEGSDFKEAHANIHRGAAGVAKSQMQAPERVRLDNRTQCIHSLLVLQ